MKYLNFSFIYPKINKFISAYIDQSLPIISCFYTKKSNMPSVTPLSILNNLVDSSFTSIPCLIDSRIKVSLINMYCLNVMLNLWHNSYSYFVKYVVFFSFFSIGVSFLAALLVFPFNNHNKIPFNQSRLRRGRFKIFSCFFLLSFS